ncbi:MAG: sigma-70 RNA polymerase sigma factor region 4 domain-containing protein [Planctomycetota bacterium]|jgi:DNA-directed RNA polymerase specialized sigma24 family protein
MSRQKHAADCGIAPSCAEENEVLFTKLSEVGETTRQLTEKLDQARQAAQRLVEGNVGYVIARVDWFLDDHPEHTYLRDDLVSEGFLTLTRLATKLIEKEKVSPDVFNPGGMMSICLRNSFINLVKKERTREVDIGVATDRDLSYEDTFGVSDLMADLLSMCNTMEEREIIKLRAQGFNDTEIGAKLGRSQQSVNRIRNELHQRYQAKQ